jgi:predicted 3-demethylubiquinone-9 3-methyltransferase (glyoxalase superfamily)
MTGGTDPARRSWPLIADGERGAPLGSRQEEFVMASKITPCLWFDGKAEEAAKFYTSLFPNSRIDKINRSPADTPSGPAGTVLTVDFIVAGQPFIGLNGGPDFKFNEAVSFSIDCEDQAEVDKYWDALIVGGGEPSVCGWLKDRFGLSWQVVPRQLVEYMESPDREAAKRATEAMLQMTKIDVEKLREAFEGVKV